MKKINSFGISCLKNQAQLKHLKPAALCCGGQQMKACVPFLPIQGQRTEGSIILRHLQTQALVPQASEPLTEDKQGSTMCKAQVCRDDAQWGRTRSECFGESPSENTGTLKTVSLG